MLKQKIWFIVTAMFFISLGQFVMVRAGAEIARAFAGQDLNLNGAEVISYQLSTSEHVLVFESGISMSIGAYRYSADQAVVRLESMVRRGKDSSGRSPGVDYKATVYLRGDVSAKKAATSKATDLSETVLKKGEEVVVGFNVSGEVFVTAEKRQTADPRGMELYKYAEVAVAGGEYVPAGIVEAEVLKEKAAEPEKKIEPEKQEVKKVIVKKAEPKEVKFVYPVNIAPAGDVEPEFERTSGPNGTFIITVTGRFYLWQKQNEDGDLLEIQADRAVAFGKGGAEAGSSAFGEGLEAIYVAGDILVTEGSRTTRADEMYYDFQQKKALVINAVMRSYDRKRGIPIYVRAGRLRQVAENKFMAENITLTSSEFHKPQVSTTASSIIITDTTSLQEDIDAISDSSYEAEMRDLKMKVGDQTIFAWPYMKSDLERPDLPIKSVHAGYDSEWGGLFETRWYLSRLLGLKEPEGVDSTFALDYFGRRGVGTGAEIKYERENYYGRTLGYIIQDSGEDDLGRDDTRQNIDPPRELRGRFSWLHRQFLPYDWQLTTGVGYASDENFVEEFYKSEFNTGMDDTYLHLKRIEDNWGLAFLGKGRINDFQDEFEEMPSGEYHLTGQSVFDDRFTLYSDSKIGLMRQRIGNDHTTAINEDTFTSAMHRTELDMPVSLNGVKMVPYVAGNYGYDDRSGFTRTRVDGSNTGEFGESNVLIGELGVRVAPRAMWKVYPNVKSRLWNLNKLRHVIEPGIVAAVYEESDNVVDQRNMINLSLSQRLQTKRGPIGNQRDVDWMRLDMGVTWVNDSDPASSAGADRLIWSNPMVPLRIFSAPQIFNGDLVSGLGTFENWGPRRNYFSTDFLWQVSDTSAFLSDMYFDMQSGVVEQMNVGISHLRWPNLQLYLGNRYLKRTEILEEKGTNALTFAATYKLDPRYTMAFSQQYDFDYGASIRSEISLIRRYHRLFYGLTFRADQSLDRQAIILSVWPQGVSELGVGSSGYADLGSSDNY